MKGNIYNSNYFFVDESGDTTFYNRKGEWIVGEENGASKILLMGFIRTTEPEFLRKKLNKLKDEIMKDEYLKGIPSIRKTKIAFHAKDDCPEVRYKVFTLLKELPFSCNIVVAVQRALNYTESKLNTTIDCKQKILPQTPSGEVCLQIVDYCNWAIQRAFLQNDMRYYNFLKEKFGLIVDLYDYKERWKNFYSKRNPFDMKKISPLRLGIKILTA